MIDKQTFISSSLLIFSLAKTAHKEMIAKGSMALL